MYLYIYIYIYVYISATVRSARSGVPPMALQPWWRNGSSTIRGLGPQTLCGSSQLHPIFVDLFHHLFIIQNVSQEPQQSQKMTPKSTPEIIKNLKFRKRENQWTPLYLLWFWDIQHPTFRHFGHRKRMPTPTRRRTLIFLRFFSDFCELGVPWGGRRNQLFHHSFESGPLGVPLGGPGSPNDTQMHQNCQNWLNCCNNNTNMTPKSCKTKPRNDNKNIKQITNANTHPSPDHFVRAPWRVCRRQFDIYICFCCRGFYSGMHVKLLREFDCLRILMSTGQRCLKWLSIQQTRYFWHQNVTEWAIPECIIRWCLSWYRRLSQSWQDDGSNRKSLSIHIYRTVTAIIDLQLGSEWQHIKSCQPQKPSPKARSVAGGSDFNHGVYIYIHICIWGLISILYALC